MTQKPGKKMTVDEKDYQLYLVTDESFQKEEDFLSIIEESLKGGVSMVQLREKHLSSKDLYHRAEKLAALTSTYNIPLIINDRADIAMAVGAHGVHLGQEDLPLPALRRMVKEELLIGVSVATKEEALQAEAEGADYLGVGALYPTETKANTRKVSLEQLYQIQKAVKIPIVGIGGINENNVAEVMDQEIQGVAVVSAITKAKNPMEAAKKLKQRMIQNTSI
ncbi:thiamine phosphate synthase [Tindallia californiensis]|uniref:Thiamine-phosphate synthase n=1 Tax=Tindallia californiensis TaxID=159292 RepID=A0A1H3QEW5_9FIRM|nr:thiamine phosphate synthase [Tindallia californiensis]SDZ11897.1 thiamine-phosphate diphosphorylase [Tindallia californiensis]